MVRNYPNFNYPVPKMAQKENDKSQKIKTLIFLDRIPKKLDSTIFAISMGSI